MLEQFRRSQPIYEWNEMPEIPPYPQVNLRSSPKNELREQSKESFEVPAKNPGEDGSRPVWFQVISQVERVINISQS